MKKVTALLISVFVSLFLPLFALPMSANSAWAASYYVDPTKGFDTKDGLSPETAWQTINKVNTSSFSPGDSILFKRGEVWREQLTVPSSGSVGKPITFGAYGSGANPKIYRTNYYNNWWEHSLIANGGFESNIIGIPNDRFTSWVGFNCTTKSSVKADNTIAHTGGNTSLRLTAAGTGFAFGSGDYATCSQTIAKIQNSKTYYFSVWGMVSTSGQNALILRIKDLANNLYLDSNGVWQTSAACATWDGAPINTWIQKTISFTTSDSGSISLEIDFYNFQTGNSWIDDAYFVQGNAPSSTRIWAGTVNGNNEYWGMIKDGNRTLSYNPRVDPFAMANGYFNGGWGKVFYYRQDASNPGMVEIGVRERAILVNSKNYITIDGIDCYGPGGSTTNYNQASESLVDILGTSDHVIVKNGDISYGSEFGTYAHGNRYGDISTTTNISFDNLTVHDCQSTGIYNSATGGGVTNSKIYAIGLIATDDGDMGGIGIQGGNLTISGNELYNIGRTDRGVDSAISCVGSLNPLTITRNYLHNLSSGGIQIAEGGNNSVVAYNIIHRFGTTSADPNATSAGHFGGIRIGGGQYGATGITVANNVISWGAQRIDVNHGSLSVVCNDTSNLLISNNIFFNNLNKDIYMEYQKNITCDHNLYYKADYTNNWQWQGVVNSTLSGWQGFFSTDLHSSTTDPLFINASGLYSSPTDFIPIFGSPCQGAGINVGLMLDFCGAPVPYSLPDIGAYQIAIPPAILPANQSFPSDGGGGSISVSAAATYPWSAVGNDSWITVDQVAAPQGNGVVYYRVTPNTASTTRQGSITVAGLQFIISQDAAPAPPPPPPAISPTSQSFSSDGGSSSINVSAAVTYPWSATSTDSWITIDQVTATEGNGTVYYSVTPNTGSTTRQGFIAVAGQQLTVSQTAASPPTISPTSQSFSNTGGSDSINVSAAATYSWSAVSNASWITIRQVTATQGDGIVYYSVARNTKDFSRQGTLTIAGQQFSVSQAAK